MGKILSVLMLASSLLLFGMAADTVKEPTTGKTFDAHVKGTEGDTTLTCVGTGCRKATALGVKVYAVAHWVDAKCAQEVLADWKGKSAEDIQSDQKFYDALCAADCEKRLRLVFVRKVSAKQIREGFKDSLDIVYGKKLSPDAEKFLALFTEDLKSGDTIELRSLPGHVIEVRQNDKTLGTLPEDAELATAIWGIYFHKKLADGHLEDIKPKLVAQFSDAL